MMEPMGDLPPARLPARISHTLQQILEDTEASKETVRQTGQAIYRAPHPSAEDSRRDTKPSGNEAELRLRYFHDGTAPAALVALHHAKTDALDHHYSPVAPPPPMHRVNARDQVVERDRGS